MYSFGIFMGADSAVTIRNQSTGEITEVQTGITKVYHIPKINSGLSCWGNGMVGEMPLEQFIPDFITSREDDYTTIHEFAEILQNTIRDFTLPITAAEGTHEYRYGNRGFHLAGFVDFEGRQVPTFYHIHNGLSEVFSDIDPRELNANQDWTPEKVFNSIQSGYVPYVRNGDFLRFARLFDGLYDPLMNLTIEGRRIRFPSPSKFANQIEAYSEFVRFWIRLTRDVYALSDLPEIIGGDISVLSLSPNGGHEISVKS